MGDFRSFSRPAPLLAAGVVALTGLACPGRDARGDDVSSSGKGIAGGVLAGAEVVTIVESIAGVRQPWIYAVSAGAGAIGGGVGGYFLEKGSSDGVAPTYLLAGGLALLIPAVILYLNGTRYQPEEGSTEDHVPAGPPAEPGVPGMGITTAPQAPPVSPPPSQSTPAPMPAPPPAALPPPQSLIDVGGGKIRMGVPVPDLRRTLTVAEERQYGARSSGELRMPVLHVVF